MNKLFIIKINGKKNFINFIIIFIVIKYILFSIKIYFVNFFILTNLNELFSYYTNYYYFYKC
jgi:hypothetical protein